MLIITNILCFPNELDSDQCCGRYVLAVSNRATCALRRQFTPPSPEDFTVSMSVIGMMTRRPRSDASALTRPVSRQARGGDA